MTKALIRLTLPLNSFRKHLNHSFNNNAPFFIILYVENNFIRNKSNFNLCNRIKQYLDFYKPLLLILPAARRQG